MRRLANIPGITFLLFFAWKVSLLIFTTQPVPANDAFFYDGPVVNYLLHGKYCNPSLIEVLPISGGEVFSAYPPLHQFALLAWMKFAGPSARSAMWYHVVWLGVFTLAVFGTLQQLRAASAAINWAGGFLFGLTFHDRPDTLAHALGALAVCALVTGWGRRARLSDWRVVGLLLLTFCTSLQIGGIYSLLVALLVAGRMGLRLAPIPWLPALAFLGVLLGLILLVRFGFPQWWSGFQEHVVVTPSLTGWRWPSLDECLKVGRSGAGTFVAVVLLGGWLAKRKLRFSELRNSAATLVAMGGGLTTLSLAAACLFVLSPNTIHIATYLQPLVVGACLAAVLDLNPASWIRRCAAVGFAAALTVVSIRAVGLSTWGVKCNQDFSYADAMRLIPAEISSLRGEHPVAASSAYLYEVARVSPVRWIHSDWLGTLADGRADLTVESILHAQPQKLILTQFDYYRRYQPLLNGLAGHPAIVELRVRNLAHVTPPDASPTWQKVVQHLAWAPLVVDITWQPAARN